MNRHKVFFEPQHVDPAYTERFQLVMTGVMDPSEIQVLKERLAESTEERFALRVEIMIINVGPAPWEGPESDG